MRKLSFYPRLAARSIKSNRQFYLPYLLTVIGACAAMYILYALFYDPGFDRLAEGTANGQVYTQMFMSIGITLVTLFCFVFLIYTNSFLMKRRQKELGLYSVLGLSKRNIAGIMVYESLYIGIIGIALGLALGILLHKLMTLLLHSLMRMPASFGFEVQLAAVFSTALFFALMIVLTLLFNLVRVGRLKPVELLHGGEVGEKEPRVKWLVVIIGVVSLGIGYGIAVMVRDSMWAISLYFIAVFFVIIGTYCLFTSLSILALKALKRNKRYYYKSKHFITVSGMLYRMKRNGVGLANICIIATMVMVMISGTLSMYLGAGEMVELSAPTDIVMQARHYYSYTEGEDEETRVPMDTEKLNAYALSRYKELGYEPTSGYQIEYLDFSAEARFGEDDLRVTPTLYVVPADTYALLSGEDAPQLAPGEALFYTESDWWEVPEISFNGSFKFLISDIVNGRDYSDPANYEFTREYRVVGECKNVLNSLVRAQAVVSFGEEAVNILVVDSSDTLEELGLQTQHGIHYWEGRYDFAQLSGAEQLDLVNRVGEEPYDFDAAGCGYVGFFMTDTRASVESDIYGLTGGFLFLGVFLGVVFMMAAVLIIYYKQVSEGYEDQRRFSIMRKVGLSEREARRSIRSQILTVFYLPLIVAAVHIAFDFRLVVLLLSLFSLYNVTLTALCTLGTLAVFCLIYAIVYALTARAYYKIVGADPEEART